MLERFGQLQVADYREGYRLTPPDSVGNWAELLEVDGAAVVRIHARPAFFGRMLGNLSKECGGVKVPKS